MKAAAYEKTRKAAYWARDNKEMVVVLVPVIAGGVKNGVKILTRCNNLRKEEELKNLYCYDRRLGHYWKLRRELSNKEWLEIERRKARGERLANILADLKVLK